MQHNTSLKIIDLLYNYGKARDQNNNSLNTSNSTGQINEKLSKTVETLRRFNDLQNKSYFDVKDLIVDEFPFHKLTSTDSAIPLEEKIKAQLFFNECKEKNVCPFQAIWTNTKFNESKEFDAQPEFIASPLDEIKINN
jgi:hypothetical protein